MSNYGRHYIAEHDGFKVLKLRYKSSSPPYTSMCIFLPDALDGLGSLLEKITSSPGFLREHLPASMALVFEFGVPKFELTFESSVKGVLKDLGLVLPFGEGADLSEMMEDMHVQDVFQKAVIEVNEEGTRAAAVTVVLPSPPTCSPCWPRTVDFVADHPFAYCIVEEESHEVLFAGHVVDPSNGAGAVIPSPPPFGERNSMKRKFHKVSDEVLNRSNRAFFGGPAPALPIPFDSYGLSPNSISTTTAGVQKPSPTQSTISGTVAGVRIPPHILQHNTSKTAHKPPRIIQPNTSSRTAGV